MRGVLTGAGLGVAEEHGDQEEEEENPFVVVTGLGESFTISARPSTNREFPIGAVVALRVWLTNNGTQGITDLELSGRSVLLHDVAVTPSPLVKDDVLAPTWSFGGLAASGVCTDERAAGFFWEYTGTAPVAAEGRFANFTRGFEHSELVAIQCVAPRITLNVVFDPMIDTHLYQAVVEPDGSPDFDYETMTRDTVTADEYAPEWSTELRCGERLDGGGPWELAYFQGAPNGPGGGGCLRVQEENSTIVLTVTQELPLGIGTCTFMYEQGAWEHTGAEDLEVEWTSMECPDPRE